VYKTSNYISCKKEMFCIREMIIIATSNSKSVVFQFLEDFLNTIFLKLFLHELLYEFNDSID
jgi:hypothetical protein